ncbi:hypothetical protein HYU07_05035 [Candidatus Woesearchaeota archaeon]|nr:hypothetical protein [Candidatus Woesearchaeota archaeon]
MAEENPLETKIKELAERAKQLHEEEASGSKAKEASIYEEFGTKKATLISLVDELPYDPSTGLPVPERLKEIMEQDTALGAYAKSNSITDKVKKELNEVDEKIEKMREKAKTTLVSALFPYGLERVEDNVKNFVDKKPFGKDERRGLEICKAVCRSLNLQY